MKKVVTAFLATISIFSSSPAPAEDWTDLVALSGELAGFASEVLAKGESPMRSALLDETVSRWAQMAAKLDVKSHNLLVYSLLETYHGGNKAERDFAEMLLIRLNGAVAPQLEAQRSAQDVALIGPNAVEYAFATFSVGKMSQLICAKTNCVDRVASSWRSLYQAHAARMAKAKVPIAGLLTYRPQPLPKVAGYLEYSPSTWSQMVKQVRQWRPRSLSSQLVIAGLLGLAMSGGEYGYARITEQKIPPESILRLSQVHRACDLSLALAELTQNCRDGKAACADKEAAKKQALQIVSESAVLSGSFQALENLDVKELIADSQDLISRIPAKHQKLFKNIIASQGPERQLLCQRLTLNDSAQGLILQDAGLLDASPAADAQKSEKK